MQVVKIRLQQQMGLTEGLLKYKDPIHCARNVYILFRRKDNFKISSGRVVYFQSLFNSFRTFRELLLESRAKECGLDVKTISDNIDRYGFYRGSNMCKSVVADVVIKATRLRSLKILTCLYYVVLQYTCMKFFEAIRFCALQFVNVMLFA
ncbi:hypothetical protein Tco_0088272 [Tanacetum coccineum]